MSDTENLPEHPGWCQGTHDGQFHESPRNEIYGRNDSRLAAQVNEYGTGPFVSVSAFVSPVIGGSITERDPENVEQLAGVLDALAGAGAKQVRELAAQVRQANRTAYGYEPGAEA